MKTFHLTAILLICSFSLVAQTNNVGIGTSSPDNSAILDIVSTSKGVLIPRMNSSLRGNLNNPAEGLIVYDTGTKSLWYHNGTDWINTATVFIREFGIVKNGGSNDDDFVFGDNEIPQNGVNKTESLFLFDESKGAFRAGWLADSPNWSRDSMGLSSVAMGYNSKAKGVGATSLGYFTEANGNNSVALGGISKAHGLNSVAIGSATSATGISGNAFGTLTQANGNFSTALGSDSYANGNFSTAIGNNVLADAYNTVAMGIYNIGGGNPTTWVPTDPILEVGIGTIGDRENALTILKNGTVSFKNYTFPLADGIVDQVVATDGAGNLSWVTSADNTVFEDNSGTIRNKGDNNNDFVFGADSLPANGEDFSESLFFFDESNGAFRAGVVFSNQAWSPDSIGFNSTAFGNKTRAIGDNSFATGFDNRAVGYASLASGHSNEATGDFSFATGQNTAATGIQAVSFGGGTIASGNQSIASGSGTEASGAQSVAMGWNTYASGASSLATGHSSNAFGDFSAALGYFTIASSYAATALGLNNVGGGNDTIWVATDPILEVGIGVTSAERENGLMILKNGTVSFKDYTFPLTDGSANQVMTTDGSGNLSWNTSSDNVNDADADPTNEIQSVSKVGSTVSLSDGGGSYVDVGVFEIAGNVVRNSGSNDNDFILGNSELPPNGVDVSESLFFFDESKSAFRAGRLEGSPVWSTDSLGSYSVAMGWNPKATDFYGVSIGRANQANAYGSRAIGYIAQANGELSISMGAYTMADAYQSTAIGAYNVGGGNATSWVGSDPILEVGNGEFLNPRNAMTILKNGKVGIGTAVPDVELHLLVDDPSGRIAQIENENTGTNSDGLQIKIGPTSNPTTNNAFIAFRDNGNNVNGSITGDAAGGINYNTTSDRRLKDNIRPFESGLDIVKKINVRSYERKSRPGVEEIGYIAQELLEVYPSIVSGTPGSPIEEPMSVDYGKITPLLVAAIQEQQKIIKDLEERLKAIELNKK